MSEEQKGCGNRRNGGSRKERIIIADDDPTTRIVAQQSLEQHGYEVITCMDGQEVLASLQVLSRAPDLFILDIGMPRLDGFATCREIRKLEEKGLVLREDGRPVPVLFVSSYDTLDNRRQGFLLKSMDFLTKPITRESIAAAVDAVLHPCDYYKDMTALVVDDDPVVRLLTSHCLRNLGLSVREAENGSQAYKTLDQLQEPVDLILVDYRMAAMQGDELIYLLRQRPPYRHIPMIVMSGDGEKDAVLTLFRLGASDYLVKPFIHEELVARVRVHLNERRYQRQLETVNTNLYTLAVRDELTGLYNRRYFSEWLARVLASHQRHGQHLSCLFFDIDYFKKINDQFGHGFGDFVLKEIGNLLPRAIRAGDLSARYGGEEFVVALPNTSHQDAWGVAERIRARIEQHAFSSQGATCSITVSIGLSGGVPDVATTVETLIARADNGMYLAKDSGRNRICEYPKLLEIG